MKKNHPRLIHLCLIISLLLLCSTSQVFAAAKVNLKNTKIKLSATKLTYNQKVQHPKVSVTYKGKVLKEKKNYVLKYSKGCKKVGTYTIQIIGKGTYKGTVKKQFTILPPKTQILGGQVGKTSANVVLKRQTTQTSGYQLRYATNSKLQNAKSITVKGNKNNTISLNGLNPGTTYYMQARTYMTVKGKKYYSKWSSINSRTTIGNSGNNTPNAITKPTPTPTPVPQLTLEYGAENITLESGKYYDIQISNGIEAIDISDPSVVYPTDGNVGGCSASFATLDPGKCVITITDIYGQKITSTVTVTQKLYNSTTDTYSVVASEVVDNTLPVPQITATRYGEGWITLECLGTSSDSNIGYEGYLSYNDKFEYSIQNQWTSILNNGSHGDVSFDYLYTGYTYYTKVRTYTIRNNVKVVGPWSKTHNVNLPRYDIEGTAPAKYTYEVYGLDKQKADIYTGCTKPLFIKTDNPDLNSFSLVCNGKSPLVDVYSGGTTHIYDDIPYENDDSEVTSLKKVKGGYIGYVDFDKAGTYDIEFREYSMSGYTVAKTVTLNVLDFNQAADAWTTDIINKTTTSNMTPFEKMDAVCAYLTDGRFKYVTVHGDNLVSLAAEPDSPYFITYRWDSYVSPAALCKFAKLIGGFDDIHNCYGDYPRGSAEWSATHYMIKLTIGNETREFFVCPLSSTGEVGETQMIDLTDLSNMRKFG